MTMLIILGIVIGAALVVAAGVGTRRSGKNNDSMQLGVGRKFRP